MPRTTTADRTTSRGRRRTTRQAQGTRAIVDQIAQLVAANEALQRGNRELTEENQRLRSELTEIGSALGRLTSAPRGRRGRRGAEPLTLTEAKPRRQRKPITDPEVLAKRNQALAKARAARAERLAAARAAGAQAETAQ